MYLRPYFEAFGAGPTALHDYRILSYSPPLLPPPPQLPYYAWEPVFDVMNLLLTVPPPPTTATTTDNADYDHWAATVSPSHSPLSPATVFSSDSNIAYNSASYDGALYSNTSSDYENDIGYCNSASYGSLSYDSASYRNIDYSNDSFNNTDYSNANYGKCNYGSSDYGKTNNGNLDNINADYSIAEYSNTDNSNTDYSNTNYGNAPEYNVSDCSASCNTVSHKKVESAKSEELVVYSKPTYSIACSASKLSRLAVHCGPLAAYLLTADRLDATRAKCAAFAPTRARYRAVTGASPLFVVDCEMCRTTADRLELARVSILNEAGAVVVDTLVRPENEIVDYLTAYSGISAPMLRGVRTRLADVQRVIRDALPADAVLVGHTLDSDLCALRLTHPYCVDVGVEFNLSGHRNSKTALRTLTRVFLGREIQRADGRGHCSVEDCAATLDLVRLKLANGWKFGNIWRGWNFAQWQAKKKRTALNDAPLSRQSSTPSAVAEARCADCGTAELRVPCSASGAASPSSTSSSPPPSSPCACPCATRHLAMNQCALCTSNALAREGGSRAHQSMPSDSAEYFKFEDVVPYD